MAGYSSAQDPKQLGFTEWGSHLTSALPSGWGLWKFEKFPTNQGLLGSPDPEDAGLGAPLSAASRNSM